MPPNEYEHEVQIPCLRCKKKFPYHLTGRYKEIRGVRVQGRDDLYFWKKDAYRGSVDVRHETVHRSAKEMKALKEAELYKQFGMPLESESWSHSGVLNTVLLCDRCKKTVRWLKIIWPIIILVGILVFYYFFVRWLEG